MVRVGLKGEGDRRRNIRVTGDGCNDEMHKGYTILFTVASRPKILQNNSKPAEKIKQLTGKIGGHTVADFGPVFWIRIDFMRIRIQLSNECGSIQIRILDIR
jgi:hypothetical protein